LQTADTGKYGFLLLLCRANTTEMLNDAWDVVVVVVVVVITIIIIIIIIIVIIIT
jgi:hypothetical protein